MQIKTETENRIHKYTVWTTQCAYVFILDDTHHVVVNSARCQWEKLF